MSAETPEPWATAMVEARCIDPRRKQDVPSITQLAARANLAVETVRRMIRGEGDPEPPNVEAVAEALGKDAVEVSGWIGQARTVREPYEAPADVALLTREEQNAINDLIRAIAKTRRTERTVVHSTGSGKTEAAVRELAGRRGPKEPTTPSTQAARTVRRRPKGNPAVDEADKDAERGDTPGAPDGSE